MIIDLDLDYFFESKCFNNYHNIKHKKMIHRFLIIFAFLGLLSCDKDELDNESNIREDKELILELYDKSVDTIMISTHRYILDAYLWRDFMPISPPDGQPLSSINWLIDIDTLDIPLNIDLKEQYVIYNDSIWIADYEDEIHTTPSYKIEKISRNGPKWGPKIYVDIVSKIHDSNTNTDYFLKLKNIYIKRTD
jgi:hypothetical protein